MGYKSYNVATSAFKDLAKAKAGKAAAGAAGGARGPQDIFKWVLGLGCQGSTRKRLPRCLFPLLPQPPFVSRADLPY